MTLGLLKRIRRYPERFRHLRRSTVGETVAASTVVESPIAMSEPEPEPEPESEKEG